MTTISRRSRIVAFASLMLLGALSAQPLFAANQAVMTVSGKKNVFNSVAAFSGESYGEKRIIILATSQQLPAHLIAKVRAKDAEDNNDSELERHYLKAVFTESGEFKCIVGRGQNTSFTTRSSDTQAQLKQAENRVKGTVTLVEEGDFAKDINFTFDVPYGISTEAPMPQAPQAPVKPSVAGKFLGNRKTSKLAYVTVYPAEPFNDRDAIVILFSEKDHSQKQDPWIGASFGDFGSALIVRCDLTGGIHGCEVSHAAHDKRGFSTIGDLDFVEFDTTGGNLRGQLSTNGEQEVFGETWEADLKFAAPLPAATIKSLAKMDAPAKVEDAPSTSASDADEDDSKPAEPKRAVPTLSVYDLVLPKGSNEIQYKKLVEQFTFKCPAKVQAAAGEMSRSLQSKGWTTFGSDLVTAKSAILKRKNGDAELTIMVKPDGTGSRFTVFTDGLNWEKAAGAAEMEEPAVPDDLDIDAEINKALDEIRKIKIDF